jgi:maleylacetate reductase
MRVFDCLNQDRVVFEARVAAAVSAEVARRNVQRVFIVSARSLSQTQDLRDIIAALGPKFVGHSDLIEPHVPLPAVIELSKIIGHANPDLVVVVGGGGAIDSVKLATLALAEGITSARGMMNHTAALIGISERPAPYRTIAIPTTLSGAEFSLNSGGVDTETEIKHLFRAPYFCAATVIYDPYLASRTPLWLWLSTGMRAVDHAVEGFLSPDANPFTDGAELYGLRYLARALPRSKQQPLDWRARSDGQMGCWLAAAGIGRLRYGASHGLGHQLGALTHVPHGHISCVLLPAVLAYNESVCASKYGDLATALGKPNASAPSAVAHLIAELELPAGIRDLKVDKALLPVIARSSLGNPFVMANPRPVATVEDAMQILDEAWLGQSSTIVE